MPSATIHRASSYELADFPLTQEQIIEGSPLSRIWINAQSADKKVTQGVWDCTAGCFSWEFTWDEFVMVIEGQAKIAPEGGEPFTLNAGDFCHFPLGLKTVWQVDNYIKKSFTLRSPEPLEL